MNSVNHYAHCYSFTDVDCNTYMLCRLQHIHAVIRHDYTYTLPNWHEQHTHNTSTYSVKAMQQQLSLHRCSEIMHARKSRSKIRSSSAHMTMLVQVPSALNCHRSSPARKCTSTLFELHDAALARARSIKHNLCTCIDD